MDSITTCIIVEDEPLARELMEMFITQTPNLVLKGQFDNGIDAIHYLRQNAIDLIFSDIEMPQLNGMDLAKSLIHAPYFIFTTAYEQYAIDGFEIGAIDYIRKPVTYARFLKAIEKANMVIHHPISEAGNDSSDDLFIKADGILHRLRFSEIKYLETKGDYISIHLNDGTTVSQLSSMKAMEEKLPPTLFFRIHTSFIVPTKNIRKLFGNMVVLNTGEELPVAKPRKQELFALLNIKE